MSKFAKELKINHHTISGQNKVFFIADIAANHDGSLNRAIDLIYLAADAGADAAKFQHFKAETIVSDIGFRSLKNIKSHQSQWKKSVFDIYKDASVNLDWTPELKKHCEKAGIIFFTSPYDLSIVDEIDPHVPAYKIGSGDITWLEMIVKVAKKNKPYFIASGASNMDDVKRAVDVATNINNQIVLMQCNTNYTADLENFKYINLNVLKTYQNVFPDILLGLSDHTPGCATTLGAIALGAKVIEKHFTDDNLREGPDHKFSMDPISWKDMVDRSRELEYSLGSGIKTVEKNEEETMVLQRRAIRYKGALKSGVTLSSDLLQVLRPCPSDALPPYFLQEIIGRSLLKNVDDGEYVRWSDVM